MHNIAYEKENYDQIKCKTRLFLSHIDESLNRKIYLWKFYINEYHIMVHIKKKSKEHYPVWLLSNLAGLILYIKHLSRSHSYHFYIIWIYSVYSFCWSFSYFTYSLNKFPSLSGAILRCSIRVPT